MITAVFDTNIFFQAAVGFGPAHACWKLVESGAVRVFVTELILDEIEDVFLRAKLRRQFPVLTFERVETLLINYRTHSHMIGNVNNLFALPRDLDEAIFINLALMTNAEYLVSRDKDLLDLRRDTGFTSQYPSLKIVDPFEFLESIRAK
jgi:putative toxin-antitoxin system toxin component, PIN family